MQADLAYAGAIARGVQVNPLNLADNGLSPFFPDVYTGKLVPRHSGDAVLYFNPAPAAPIDILVRAVSSEATMVIPVVEDGVETQTLTVPASVAGTETWVRLTPTPGRAVLEVWATPSDSITAPPNGASLYACSFVAVVGAVPALPAQPDIMFIFWGASLTQGKQQTVGTDRGGQGFVGQFRRRAYTHSYRACLDAFGSRSLINSGQTAAQIGAAIGKFPQGRLRTEVIISDMQVTGHSFDGGSFAAWGQAVTDVTNAIAANVTAPDYRITWTLANPYPGDTGVIAGHTLADFNTETGVRIAGIPKSRTLDLAGAGLVPGDYNADGLHWIIAGHTKVANFHIADQGI